MTTLIDKPVYPSLLYLWDKRTLYIGPMFEPLRLSQAAATLLVSLDEAVFITLSDRSVMSCRSLLVPAGQSIKIDTGSAIIACCYLDAMGCDYVRLKSQMQRYEGGVYLHSANENLLSQTCLSWYHSPLPSDELFLQLDQLLSAVVTVFLPCHTDVRIETVIRLIKSQVNAVPSVDALAEAVGLSRSRLVQLFKQQTGVPIRRYRLWHRLYVTALRMGQGESLTDAAIGAGFADSSHCTHTFRDMLGIKPSLLLGQTNKLCIVIPSEVLSQDLS